MTSEEQTIQNLLALVQGRNQRIVELEMQVLNLTKQIEEGANHANGESLQGKENQREETKRVFNEIKEKEKIS